MAQTQITSIAVAAELLWSISAELTILFVCLLLSLTYHGGFRRQIGLDKQERKTLSSNPGDPPQKPPNRKERRTTTRAESERSQSPSTSSTRSGQSGKDSSDGSNDPNCLIECAPWKMRAVRQAVVAMAQENSCKQISGKPAESAQKAISGLSSKIASMVSLSTQGKAAEAIAVYEKVRATGAHLQIKAVQERLNKSPADVYAVLLQSAFEAERPEFVEKLLQDMTDANIEWSHRFYEKIMKMLQSKDLFKEALYIHSVAEAKGLEPMPITLTRLVIFAAKLGDRERAISLFNQVSARSVPHIRCYMTILRVYSQSKDWSSSLALLRDMQKRGVPINALTLNVVLSTGVAARQISDVKALLEEFAKDGVADVISYNTVMHGLKYEKATDHALVLLEDMRRSDLKPDLITFNSAIDVAIHSLRNVDAWHFLSRMRDAGLVPDRCTCHAIAKGVQKATSEELMPILDIMKNVTGEHNFYKTMFGGVIDRVVQLNERTLTTRAARVMKDHRGMFWSQDHQRLLRALQ